MPSRNAPRRCRVAASSRPVFEHLEPRTLLAATWQSLNPGAGGQVQEVVLDPT